MCDGARHGHRVPGLHLLMPLDDILPSMSALRIYAAVVLLLFTAVLVVAATDPLVQYGAGILTAIIGVVLAYEHRG